MKKWKVILALFLCLSLLAGCGGPNEVPDRSLGGEEETLPTEPEKESRADRFGLSYQEDAGFNPYECTRLVNRPVVSLLYQGLFSVTSQYKAEPVLCKTYTCSLDQKTYVFTLMNARFSDGSPLEPEDVIRSLRAAQGSRVYGNRLKHVTSMEITGSDEITLKTDVPCGDLPVLLDIPVVKSGEASYDAPTGTGPYALQGEGDSLRLVRVKNWWSDYPSALSFDVIDLARTETPSEIRDQFEFGQVDLVLADPSDPSFVEYRCDYELWDCATGIMLYLGCNTARRSTFSSGTLRAALTHGVNRSALKEIYRGFAQEAYLPASPEADCYDDGLAAAFGYDPKAFGDALNATGLRGTSCNLLVCSDYPVRVTAAQAIADQLKECGLEVNVYSVGQEKYENALRVGNFDFYLGEVRLSPNFDLSCFFSGEGSLTYGGMADPALLQLSLASLENSGNYYDLFEAVMEDGQLTPLLFRTYAVYATRGTVTNLLPGVIDAFHTANSRQLSTAWVDWPTPVEIQPEETQGDE